ASIDEAEAIASRLRAAHPHAAHLCIGLRMFDGTERARDDGEPAGTAGRPILRALQSADVCNCIIVVIRYFGGILLGAPGLARAYGGVASQTLTNAREQGLLTTVEPHDEHAFTLSYAAFQHARGRLAHPDWDMHVEFSDLVLVRLQAPATQRAQVESLLSHLRPEHQTLRMNATWRARRGQ
ncbi:MAG: YigZ family protein, partial [Firmicutes bacterium]|nr:YigZ family protein [Bacillota bacterium]